MISKRTMSTSEIGPMLLTIMSTSTTAGGPRSGCYLNLIAALPQQWNRYLQNQV